jgi:hypothetical protein
LQYYRILLPDPGQIIGSIAQFFVIGERKVGIHRQTS